MAGGLELDDSWGPFQIWKLWFYDWDSVSSTLSKQTNRLWAELLNTERLWVHWDPAPAATWAQDNRGDKFNERSISVCQRWSPPAPPFLCYFLLLWELIWTSWCFSPSNMSGCGCYTKEMCHLCGFGPPLRPNDRGLQLLICLRNTSTANLPAVCEWLLAPQVQTHAQRHLIVRG